MRFQVSGQKDLYRLAHNLHEAGQKNLKRQLDKASRQAGNEIAREVQQHTKDYIPANFERRFDTAFVTEVQVRLVASRRITIVFYARGKTQRRDIRAINAGRLRKPVFGRTRRLTAGGIHVPPENRSRIVGDRYTNPWVVQNIRPGLVDEPATRAVPKARKKIEDAIDRVSQQIARG
jgi:hypothetical protein